ncbi:MAG: haloacid dehalogenase-like hydrolase [Actinomycetota bacterium]
MDLGNASVFIDFDGTITRVDTGQYLLEQLGTPDWKHFDELFDAGAIGSRECLIAQFAMLPRDEALVRKTAFEVEIDPGFYALVMLLERFDAEITVVSDGFGLYIEERTWGVRTIANAPDLSRGTISFPNADPTCECAQCGCCKRTPIMQARSRGRFTIMIGDGTSDRHAARAADLVFAKDGLAQWCELNEIPFMHFNTLSDVAACIQSGAYS